MNAPPRLGIDIGRVIIDGDRPGADTSFIGGDIAEVLRTPPMPYALDVITRLVDLFEGRVWLVSKCRSRVEQKTRLWLANTEFARRTGVPETHLRFCAERPEKAGIARELGLTHFIDDRIDVLTHLRDLVPNLFLFGPAAGHAPHWVVPTPDWPAAETAIRLSLIPG